MVHAADLKRTARPEAVKATGPDTRLTRARAAILDVYASPAGGHPDVFLQDDAGALQVFGNTEVLDIETEPEPATGLQQVTAVVTDKGRIEAEYVVIACGVWSNRVANMAGATIPLVPAVHQMADVGPLDILAETNNEIGYPIVRDMDTFCYERQSAGSMEVGW